MSALHTPGLWVASRDPHGGFGDWMIGIVGGKPDEVAVCGERDAPLISAAPLMLEALKAIAEFIPTTSALEGGAAKYSAHVVAADKVRAAISKATGDAA